MDGLRVALVHDWLTNQGGGERVLWSLHLAFPDAPIYTSVFEPAVMTQFADLDVRTSFLQKWPLARKKHQLFPALRTMAFESFDFSEYDVVISTNSAESKGIITGPKTLHINYIFTPTRYYWSGYHDYLAQPGMGRLNGLVRRVMPRVVSRMRQWDYAAAQRADMVVAISEYVGARVTKYYRRDWGVVYPPVEVDRLKPAAKRGDFYLVVSRLIPYKRVDLAVAAARELNLPLIVIGDGSERSRLEAMAGPKTQFLGRRSDAEVAEYYGKAKAFLFTADEDFGITPLEAMAAGAPVVAFGRGGALETVVPGKTGVFFSEQTPSSLIQALKHLDTLKLDTLTIRKQAERFSERRFIVEMQQLVRRAIASRQSDN